jgi:Holliday junction resolvase
MGGMSRRKGAAFEREIANMIRDDLGLEAKRNLMQTAEGGHDLLGVPGWALECKRYASCTASDYKCFWMQTVTQAEAVGCKPALIVKQDRKPIQVFISWGGLGSDCFEQSDFNAAAQISWDLFCGIVRETLNSEQE